MNTVELIKKICKERGIAISKLERDYGFSNGYIAGIKKGTLRSSLMRGRRLMIWWMGILRNLFEIWAAWRVAFRVAYVT